MSFRAIAKIASRVALVGAGVIALGACGEGIKPSTGLSDASPWPDAGAPPKGDGRVDDGPKEDVTKPPEDGATTDAGKCLGTKPSIQNTVDSVSVIKQATVSDRTAKIRVALKSNTSDTLFYARNDTGVLGICSAASYSCSANPADAGVVPDSTSPDAGVVPDAGDAGASDAGTSDAGVDASAGSNSTNCACDFTIPVDSAGNYKFTLTALHTNDWAGKDIVNVKQKAQDCGDEKEYSGKGGQPGGPVSLGKAWPNTLKVCYYNGYIYAHDGDGSLKDLKGGAGFPGLVTARPVAGSQVNSDTYKTSPVVCMGSVSNPLTATPSSGSAKIKCSAVGPGQKVALVNVPPGQNILTYAPPVNDANYPPLFIDIDNVNSPGVADSSKITKSGSVVSILADAIKPLGQYEPTWWGCLVPIRSDDEAPGDCDPTTITQLYAKPTSPATDAGVADGGVSGTTFTMSIPSSMQGKTVAVRVDKLAKLGTKVWCIGNGLVVLNP